jgi:hypothetical protein
MNVGLCPTIDSRCARIQPDLSAFICGSRGLAFWGRIEVSETQKVEFQAKIVGCEDDGGVTGRGREQFTDSEVVAFMAPLLTTSSNRSCLPGCDSHFTSPRPEVTVTSFQG